MQLYVFHILNLGSISTLVGGWTGTISDVLYLIGFNTSWYCSTREREEEEKAKE